MSLTIDYQNESISGLKADNQSSDFSPGSTGRIFFNTTDSKLKVDTGAAILIVAASTSSLTAGRVPIVGVSGILADDAGLLYGTSTLTATNATINTTLKADSFLPKTAAATIVHTSDGGIAVQAGDAVQGVLIRTLHVQTTGASQTQMTFDGTTASSSNIPTLATSSAHAFSVVVKGFNATSNIGAGMFVLKGFIQRTSGGVTSLLGGIDKLILYQATGAVDATLEADVTNNGLAIKVTGLGSTTINWVAEVREIV